jgi:hypothetical protein
MYYFMNSLKKGPQERFPSGFPIVSRFESRKLLILMVVIIAAYGFLLFYIAGSASYCLYTT